MLHTSLAISGSPWAEPEGIHHQVIARRLGSFAQLSHPHKETVTTFFECRFMDLLTSDVCHLLCRAAGKLQCASLRAGSIETAKAVPNTFD